MLFIYIFDTMNTNIYVVATLSVSQKLLSYRKEIFLLIITNFFAEKFFFAENNFIIIDLN